MSRVPFHERLKALRTARNMSLRSLAEELKQHGVDVTHTAIAKWEQPKMVGRARLPSIEVISALCKIFAVEPAWLIDEMFHRTKKSLRSERLEEFQDVELLTDEQYKALLEVKRLFLKRELEVKNGNGNNNQ